MMLKLSVLFLCLLVSACTLIYNTWATEPLDYIEFVSENNIDVEEVLKRSNEKYFCVGVEGEKSCYVRRTNLDKLEIKLYKTPEAIATDVGNVIYVTGYILVGAYLPNGFLDDNKINQIFDTYESD